MRTLLIVSAVLLATLALPSVSAESPCDPRNGPFDPCYWDCEPGWEAECTLLLRGGQTAWNYYCDRVSPAC